MAVTRSSMLASASTSRRMYPGRGAASMLVGTSTTRFTLLEVPAPLTR